MSTTTVTVATVQVVTTITMFLTAITIVTVQLPPPRLIQIIRFELLHPPITTTMAIPKAALPITPTAIPATMAMVARTPLLQLMLIRINL
jgi:hypothetical protein